MEPRGEFIVEGLEETLVAGEGRGWWKVEQAECCNGFTPHPMDAHLCECGYFAEEHKCKRRGCDRPRFVLHPCAATAGGIVYEYCSERCESLGPGACDPLTMDEARLRLWAFAQMASAWIDGGSGGSTGEWHALKASEADLLARLTGDVWKPFASAPREDMPILAYREDAGVLVARFCESDDGESTRWFTDEGEDLTGDLPTHWMPIPTPPQGFATRGGDTA